MASSGLRSATGKVHVVAEDPTDVALADGIVVSAAVGIAGGGRAAPRIPSFSMMWFKLCRKRQQTRQIT